MKHLFFLFAFILLTAKSFAQDPTLLWAKQIGGTSIDRAYSIALDPTGNGDAYTTGYFRGTVDFDPGVGTYNLTSYSSQDIFISKLDELGNFAWAKAMGGQTGYDEAMSIALDPYDASIYTTGYFRGTADFDPGVGTFNLTSPAWDDIFISKLDNSGNFTWATRMGGTNYDYGYSIAIDPTGSGNIYTTGNFQGTADFDPGGGTFNLTPVGSADIFISKIDASGNFLWAKGIGGINGDFGLAIALDPTGSGDVYITGAFSGTVDFDPGIGIFNLISAGNSDIFISKLDASGNFVWAKSLGGTGNDVGYSIALDASNNIYITGYFTGTADFDTGLGTYNLTSTGNSDIFVSKLNSSGNFVWAKGIGGIGGTACGNSVTLDINNNVYTTGYFGATVDFDPGLGIFNLTSSGNSDIFISKLDNSGNFTWATRMGGTNEDIGYSIAIDPSDNGDIYTTGSFEATADFDPGLGTYNLNSIGSRDIFISKFSQSLGVLDVGLSVSGNLDFGTVPQGSTDDMAVFLYNNTSSPIHINTITPSPTGAFNALMQNGSTILPYQSLPVSIFFFPTALTTYNTTFTVTSDAPNGDITFTAIGIGGNSPVSWFGIYNQPENNPEITSLETLEEHYTSVTTVNPIKICADGSKATIVKYINNDVNVTTSDIVFNMQSDPLGNNTDYSGWFVTPDYTYNGNTVTARFTHPKYLNIIGLYRTDAIQVVNTSNSNILYQQPVRIYRAPVVLVHGLWGATTSMLPVVDELLNSGKYNAALLQIADYSNSNSVSFNANSNVIKNNINSALIGLRILNYSAGKVDIVAHSMGGVLSRIYLQNNDCGGGLFTNCYRGDIHKLITLNTPHSGTQVANFIFSNALGSGLAQTILNYNNMPWNNGAVYDLQCNSPAINSLNGSSLNNHIVTCHAIQTDRTPATTYLSFDEEALVNIIANARLQSVGVFVDEVFAYTPTDLIVPTNSQNGGLSDFSYILDVKHTASPSDLDVITKVQTLLDANPATSVYFDQNGSGYNPPQILPTFKTDETDVEHSVQGGGTVTITNPSLGFVCTEGDVLQIDVSASVNVDHLIITAGNINTGVTSFDTLANSVSVYYTVPENIVGTVKIMAIGYDSNGFVDLDTLEIVANPDAILDSLAFVNDYINIPLGQSVPFTLNGYYSDSTIRNLNVVSNIPYDIDDVNVASLGTGHILNGLTVGTTFLHAAYQGKNAYITVNVYTGDDWVITALENEGTEISNEYNQLVIYPNPSKESVFFINNSKMQSNYELYGIMGNLLLSSRATQGVNKVNIEGLANGIYYIQLNDGEKIYSARFVKQ